jgi:hypothetical protein
MPGSSSLPLPCDWSISNNGLSGGFLPSSADLEFVAQAEESVALAEQLVDELLAQVHGLSVALVQAVALIEQSQAAALIEQASVSVSAKLSCFLCC